MSFAVGNVLIARYPTGDNRSFEAATAVVTTVGKVPRQRQR